MEMSLELCVRCVSRYTSHSKTLMRCKGPGCWVGLGWAGLATELSGTVHDAASLCIFLGLPGTVAPQ
jgi:hypothetical protein